MKPARSSRHALAFIFITVLIDMIGFGIIIPVLGSVAVTCLVLLAYS